MWLVPVYIETVGLLSGLPACRKSKGFRVAILLIYIVQNRFTIRGQNYNMYSNKRKLIPSFSLYFLSSVAYFIILPFFHAPAMTYETEKRNKICQTSQVTEVVRDSNLVHVKVSEIKQVQLKGVKKKCKLGKSRVLKRGPLYGKSLLWWDGQVNVVSLMYFLQTATLWVSASKKNSRTLI